MRNPKQPGDITVVVTKQGVSDAYELNEDPNYAELTVLPHRATKEPINHRDHFVTPGVNTNKTLE